MEVYQFERTVRSVRSEDKHGTETQCFFSNLFHLCTYRLCLSRIQHLLKEVLRL